MNDFRLLIVLLACSVLNAGEAPVAMTVDDCIRMALQHNPQILQAQEAINKAAGVVVETRSSLIPHLAATSDWQMKRPFQFEQLWPDEKNRAPDTWSIGLQITQPIFAGGRLTGSLAIARLGNDQATANWKVAVKDVILTVKKAFYDALLNRSLIDVAQQSQDLLEKNVQSQRNNLSVGMATRFDVLRAEVELANAKPLVIKARNAYRIALLDLARLIAYDKDPAVINDNTILITGELIPEPFTCDVSEALAAAMRQRDEFAALRYAIEQQQWQIKVDRSGYMPAVALFAGYNYNGLQYGGIRQETNEYVAGVQATWTLFDGLAAHGQSMQTKAALRSLALEMESVQRQIQLEVRQAHSQFIEAKELIGFQAKNIESAEETVRLAIARVEAGDGIQLDILDSQVALTRARANELQARHDYLAAIGEIQRAIGADVRFEPITPPNRLP